MNPDRLLEICKEEYPVGSEVKTEFYKSSKDKVRIVKDICEAPCKSQTNIFLQTECGLFCDIGWFEKVDSNPHERRIMPKLADIFEEVETASIDYREKSDYENLADDDITVISKWEDKQEAFTAGVKWFIENFSKFSA